MLHRNFFIGGISMKASLKFCLVCFIVLSLTLLFCAGTTLAAEKTEKGKEVTISGKVIKGEEDSETKFTSVLIQTEKEGEFEVAARGKGQELFKFIDKNVEVTGTVKEVKGKKTIKVNHFRVIE